VLHGKPLIAWTIESARQSGAVQDIIVSTDDEETAEIARAWGAWVPFLRPAEIARDDTPGVMTTLHAAELLPEYDWLLLAQPTSPLRGIQDFSQIVEECLLAKARAAVSVAPAVDQPEWTFPRSRDGYFELSPDVSVITRRQDLPARFSVKGGGLYLSERDWLLFHRTYITSETYMYVMPPERGLDIDSSFDWRVAEALMSLRDREAAGGG